MTETTGRNILVIDIGPIRLDPNMTWRRSFKDAHAFLHRETDPYIGSEKNSFKQNDSEELVLLSQAEPKRELFPP